MAIPTLAMTFDDLCVRTAEYLGLAYYGAAGTSSAATPTDTHDLDLVKRLVNDGWRRFVTAHPRGWEWMTPIINITFDADGDTDRTVDDGDIQIPRAARYYMPDGFYGQIITGWTYGQTGPRTKVNVTNEETIREAFAASGGTTGDPVIFACRPLPRQIASEQNKKWEVIFFPAPASEDTISARVRIFPHKMVNTTDKHAAGFQYDRAVLAAALAEAELQRDNAPGPMEESYQRALIEAIAIDARTGQRRLGYNGDWSDTSGAPRQRYYSGVDSYNGVSVE